AVKGTSQRLVLLLAPLARGAAGAATEPATEVVGVLESGFGRGLRDRAAAAQSLLGCRETLLIAQAPQAQAVLTFQFSAERIACVARVLRHLRKRSRIPKACLHPIKQRHFDRCGWSVVDRRIQEPGDNFENCRIRRQAQSPL